MAQTGQNQTKNLMETLIGTYAARINDLKKEIESYENEECIWKTSADISNSGGNLCLHLVGNLNHFIGANLGDTGYVRERDLEFSDKGLSRGELLGRIDDIADVVNTTLNALTSECLDEDYPEILFDKQMDNQSVLIYMSGHLAYHLGQLNYHRRLLDK